jgi:hypothetical protein
MEQKTKYDISIAIKRDADTPSPYVGQWVEYDKNCYRVVASGDTYIVIESFLAVNKKYVNKLLSTLTKNAPFLCKSLVIFRENEDDEDGVFPEYKGTIHGGIIYKERLPLTPPSTAVSCCV